MKKLTSSLSYYFISAVGISLTIKAGIGVSSFNSLNVALSNLTTIQVGTITSIINFVFLISCLIVDRNRQLNKYLLMSIATMSFGIVINFVYYTLLSDLNLSDYSLRISIFIFGIIISGFATGQILRINLLTFPIEFFCQLLDNKTKLTFASYRYGIDIFCVAISISISVLFSLPIVVREGTILSLFLLSGVISYSKRITLFWK